MLTSTPQPMSRQKPITAGVCGDHTHQLLPLFLPYRSDLPAAMDAPSADRQCEHPAAWSLTRISLWNWVFLYFSQNKQLYSFSDIDPVLFLSGHFQSFTHVTKWDFIPVLIQQTPVNLTNPLLLHGDIRNRREGKEVGGL